MLQIGLAHRLALEACVTTYVSPHIVTKQATNMGTDMTYMQISVIGQAAQLA